MKTLIGGLLTTLLMGCAAQPIYVPVPPTPEPPKPTRMVDIVVDNKKAEFCNDLAEMTGDVIRMKSKNIPLSVLWKRKPIKTQNDVWIKEMITEIYYSGMTDPEIAEYSMRQTCEKDYKKD